MIYPVQCKQLLKIGLIISVMLLWGCSETDDKTTYTEMWDSLFNTCSTGCHSLSATNGTEQGPDFSSKELFYTNTINKTVATDYQNWVDIGGRTGDCDSVNLITPGNANESLVVGSLVQTVSDRIAADNNCTTTYSLHEPLFVTITDQATIDALIEWINDGAQNN